MAGDRRAAAGAQAARSDSGAVDEQARLRELYSLRLLDTGSEERFDRITRLVADVLDVPVCLITLIAEDLQWIKAAKGLRLRHQARADSFCTHALGHDLLVVEDAREDPVFADKPIVVRAPYLRFYAGAVLHGPSGQPLGTLCILDQRPRRLGAVEKRRLREFRALVEQELAVSQRLQQTRQELLASVLHDPATGLPRDLLLDERLNALVEAAREADDTVALAVVRFTDFDRVLGTYGQEAVDKASRMFAERLQAHAGIGGLVGRLAPDRMMVAVRGLGDDESVKRWSDGVYAALTEPYAVGEGQRRATVAMGVASFPRDARSASELRSRAIVAKDNRPNAGPRRYDPEHDQRLRQEDQLHRDFAEALEAERLSLVFQPIYRADGEGPVSCEALARWDDPVRGVVSPGEFIPLAESDPELRRALTRWALHTACAAASRWNAQTGNRVSVSVNVAGPELHDLSILFEVERALANSGLAPELLVIELTERTLISDLQAAARSVRGLAERGVHCALDDFGTGYSSLGYLRRIPLQSLKMDRSFVAEVAVDAAAREVARGIVNIGRALGMHVVAEGVETEDQRAHLQAIGCDQLQGFLLGRPLPAEEVARVISAG